MTNSIILICVYKNNTFNKIKIYIYIWRYRVYEPKKEENDLNIPHYAMPTKSQAQKCVDGNRINVIFMYFINLNKYITIIIFIINFFNLIKRWRRLLKSIMNILRN